MRASIRLSFRPPKTQNTQNTQNNQTQTHAFSLAGAVPAEFAASPLAPRDEINGISAKFPIFLPLMSILPASNRDIASMGWTLATARAASDLAGAGRVLAG